MRQTWATGSDMMRMGFLISLSGLLTASGAYLLRVFISQAGGIEDVGLYSAGFAIINTYVGLIFNAMGTDYYPRLSAVVYDNDLCRQAVNQQAEIAILILGPILILFLICTEWVVELLYSDQFLAISEMLYWAAFGMFFKATSWAIGFLFLAKNASRIFFISELMVNLYMLFFNILGYYYLGLTGLGISFFFSYFLYFMQVYVISIKKFNFSFDNGFIKLFVVNIFLFLIVFLLVKIGNFQTLIIFVIISFSYSLFKVDERIGLKNKLLCFFR